MMHRRRFLGFLAAAPVAIVKPEPADDSPRRWITTQSEDYLRNQTLVRIWCRTLPAGLDSPRSVEITERGLVTRMELFNVNAAGHRFADGDEPATRIVDVAHRGIRWPATPLVLV